MTRGSIEDLEREILAQDICEQAPRKYLDSLQDDLAQQVKIGKRSKKIDFLCPKSILVPIFSKLNKRTSRLATGKYGAIKGRAAVPP